MSQHNAPQPQAQNALADLAALHRPSPTLLLSPLASLRDYFAAHAPEVPPWFRWAKLPAGLSITDALKNQPGYLSLTADDLQRLRTADDGDGAFYVEDLPERLRAIAAGANEAAAASWRARSEAEEKLRAERFFAWRWYYADQMLATRGGA
jgi:hypothetical protein